MNSALIGAIGTILGAILSGGVQFAVLQYQRKQEINALKSLFFAEILNILKAMIFWNAEKIIIINIKCAKENQPIPEKALKYFNKEVAIRCYNSSFKDVGMLSTDVSNNIIVFYNNLYAILSDLENIHPYLSSEVTGRIFEKDLGLYKQAVQTGLWLLEALNPDRYKTFDNEYWYLQCKEIAQTEVRTS